MKLTKTHAIIGSISLITLLLTAYMFGVGKTPDIDPFLVLAVSGGVVVALIVVGMLGYMIGSFNAMQDHNTKIVNGHKELSESSRIVTETALKTLAREESERVNHKKALMLWGYLESLRDESLLIVGNGHSVAMSKLICADIGIAWAKAQELFTRDGVFIKSVDEVVEA